jgi:hypothetical protein
MSGARACLGHAPRSRALLLPRTLAVARLACSVARHPHSRRFAYRPALALLARLSALPTRPLLPQRADARTCFARCARKGENRV